MDEQLALFEALMEHRNHAVHLHDFGVMREIDNPPPGELCRKRHVIAVQLRCETCFKVVKNFYRPDPLDLGAVDDSE